MMSLSALAMLQVTRAKQDHNTHCPWKKPAKEVHIHPDGLEIFGWADGDEITGLKVVADNQIPRRRLRVFCDGDIETSGNAEGVEEPVKVTELVGAEA